MRPNLQHRTQQAMVQNLGSADSSVGKEECSQEREDGIGTSQTAVDRQVKGDVVLGLRHV